MKPEPWTQLDPFRIAFGSHASPRGASWGAFIIPIRGHTLRVIASSAQAEASWDHVSVSLPNRCPNWPEMCAVKDLFWSDDEAVAQFHPPRAAYVNLHPYCLHMWKPQGIVMPLPPSWMVGNRPDQSVADALREAGTALGIAS